MPKFLKPKSDFRNKFQVQYQQAPWLELSTEDIWPFSQLKALGRQVLMVVRKSKFLAFMTDKISLKLCGQSLEKCQKLEEHAK